MDRTGLWSLKIAGDAAEEEWNVPLLDRLRNLHQMIAEIPFRVLKRRSIQHDLQVLGECRDQRLLRFIGAERLVQPLVEPPASEVSLCGIQERGEL